MTDVRAPFSIQGIIKAIASEPATSDDQAVADAAWRDAIKPATDAFGLVDSTIANFGQQIDTLRAVDDETRQRFLAQNGPDVLQYLDNVGRAVEGFLSYVDEATSALSTAAAHSLGGDSRNVATFAGAIAAMRAFGSNQATTRANLAALAGKVKALTEPPPSPPAESPPTA